MSKCCHDCGAEDVELFTMKWMDGEYRCAVCTCSSLTNINDLRQMDSKLRDFKGPQFTPVIFTLDEDGIVLAGNLVEINSDCVVIHLERVSHADVLTIDAAIKSLKES